MDKIEAFKKIIDESKNICFFGGAGVSVASGIPDFRGANGLYSYTPEEIISHSFFMKNTKAFYEFYFSKMIYKNALPNLCHYWLVELEQAGKLKAIVTQNIDGLHQLAGSNNVFELHGSVLRNYCQKCHKFYGLNELKMDGIPMCSCGGIIKPDVVLYEESLDDLVIRKAVTAIAKADTLIVVGTSLVVYPAAGLIHYFRGKNIVLINLQPTPYDKMANLVINDDVIKVITAYKNLK